MRSTSTQNIMRSDTCASSSRLARNLKEKQRRMHLNYLFSRLASFLPARPSRASALDRIDQAIGYISQFQERLRMLRKRLGQLNRKGDNPPEITITITTTGFDNEELEVNFRVSEGNRGILLQQLIHTLEEEGAQVKSLSYSTAGDKVLGTIRAEAIYVRIGIDIPNITKRLKKLAY